jgi:hypothetical protein
VRINVCFWGVSTQKQGRSGLGLEAQQIAVANFAKTEGLKITVPGEPATKVLVSKPPSFATLHEG